MIHAGNNSCDSSINYCCLNVPDRQHGEDVTADYNKRTTILLCPVRLWRSWRSIGNTPVNHFTWTWKELLLCSIDTWCPHDVNHHIARRCVHFFLCAGFSVAHVIKRGKGLCVCVCVCVCQNIQICKISVCWLFHLSPFTSSKSGSSEFYSNFSFSDGYVSVEKSLLKSSGYFSHWNRANLEDTILLQLR